MSQSTVRTGSCFNVAQCWHVSVLIMCNTQFNGGGGLQVDLTNQVTMALLFGQEAELEDRLQLIE